jgi:hypothetical protein
MMLASYSDSAFRHISQADASSLMGGDLVNVQVATNKIQCWDLFEKFGCRGSYSTNGFETDCLTGVKGTGIVPVPSGRSHGQCG